MEKWNIYDKYGELKDGYLVRGEAIPEGMFHLVVEIIVRHIDGSYLIMQRSNDKSSYPNYYEMSAGGAVVYGETSQEGALRELREETSVTSISEMKPLDRVVSEEGNYIFDNYLVITNMDKEAVRYQKGETQSHLWLEKDEVASMIKNGRFVPSQAKRILELFELNRI